MENVVAVHVLHALADLFHEEDHILLSEREVVSYDAFKQLATGNAVSGRLIFKIYIPFVKLVVSDVY